MRGGRVIAGSIPACAGEAANATITSLQAEVYPRVCGGSAFSSVSMMRRIGLSPRVRGKPLKRTCRIILGGSIPACAGEAARAASAKRAKTVYPRVCGGSNAQVSQPWPAEGLSPRVRGKRMGFCAIDTPEGSIPACAGEAPPPGHRPPAAAVYPRVCGGSSHPHSGPRQAKGLSPRVRGKLIAGEHILDFQRSIPACAGEATGCWTKRKAGKVYPRVCGGSTKLGQVAQPLQGLSPRVRGKPDVRPADFVFLRSIPACAGEAVGYAPRPETGQGLSPRVRGKPRRLPGGAGDDGSIPACAGEAAMRKYWNRLVKVYPRVCGGSRPRPGAGWTPGGLSPRVRGKRDGEYVTQGGLGSIPACAGEAEAIWSGSPYQTVYPRVCGGSSWQESLKNR